MSKPSLVAAYWTLAGISTEGDGVSRFAFRDRVEAAGRAGYTGMGLWHSDLAATLSHHSPAEMKTLLDANGIERVEVEFLLDWFADGELRKRSDFRRRFLFGLAEQLGAQLIKVGDFSRSICPMPRLIDEFAKLCGEAAEHGLTVAFEPMNSSLIRTLDDAKALAVGAAAPNGGMMFDLWHVNYLGIPFSELATFPSRYLVGAELDDGDSKTRTFCGRGGLDVAGFVTCLKSMGYEGPWGVEIISDELISMTLEDAAEVTYATTAEFLA